MNTNIGIFNDSGQGNQNFNGKTMSSREIADLTIKRHDNIIRDCENLNKHYEELSLLKIEECNYKADNGQYYREFLLTKMQSMDLLTGYSVPLRIKVNRRWEELEANSQVKAPSSLKEALMLALIQQEQIEAQQKLLEEQKPKAILADSITASKSTILIRELAIILAQNGVKIGEKRLFEFLRSNGYLVKRDGKDKNTPTQKSIDMGLFEISERTFNNSQGSFIQKTTYVTGKGQKYFINKFLTNNKTCLN